MKNIYLACLVIGLSFVVTLPAYGGCGNCSSHGPSSCKKCDDCPDSKEGDPINVYTGNEHRMINDLQIWGSTGEIPFIWKRYYNSREFRGWTHGFQYTMTDDGFDSQGRAQVSVWLAEGGNIIYTQTSISPSIWRSVPGVGEQLLQQGNNFFFQPGNGHRFRFEKLTGPAGSFYQLQDIRDSYQNLYSLTYNSNHHLIRVTEPAGRYFQIDYSALVQDGQPLISKITTHDGRSVQYDYTSFTDRSFSWVLLTSVQYGDGTRALYKYHQPHYSGPGFVYLEHSIDPRYSGTNVNMRFTYDNSIAHGYIKEELNGKTGQVMVTLTSDWRNRWVCYANGSVHHLVMPDELLGKTEQYTDGLGRTSKFTYDANGFRKTKTDALNRVTTYTKSIYDNELEIIHPDGTTEKWTRDDLDLELTHTDELGRVTTRVRDGLHRVTSIIYPDGSQEKFTYNNFGQVLTHTLRNGGIEMNVYGPTGLKTAFKDAEGHITTYAYDNADRLAAETDARGNITRYVYNERGLLAKTIHADNSMQLYTYDEFGNRTSITNEIGNTWKQLFDEFKRVISKTDPLNRETKYSYDLPGGGCGCSHDHNRPTQIIFPSGKTIAIEYDMEWQKIKETVGAGAPDAATTFYEYDLGGNLATLIDPRLKAWSYNYDARNRRISSRSPLGHETKWTYDANGNLAKEQRPDNGFISYEYDNMDRVIKTTDAKGQAILTEYDNEGNKTRLTDPNGNSYYMQYDLLNHIKKMVYPNGSDEAYAYDAAGNINTYRNRAGAVQTFAFDNRNRQVSAVWSDGTSAVNNTYDAAGRLLMLWNNASVLSYTYNGANELVSETQFITGAASPAQFSYTYNADGLRNAMAYPGGSKVLGYDHTSRNKLASITENGQTLVSYGYDLSGNKLAEFRKNQTGTSYAYDDENNPINITHQKGGMPLIHFDYGYDNMDRRTFVRRNYSKGDVYTYDAVDQVKSVRYEVTNPQGMQGSPERTVGYDHDAAGNRMQVIDNGSSTNYVSNTLNQYTAVNGNALTYTTNGELSAFNGWSYTYDAQGRLVKAEKGGTLISFAYDASNRCVKRVVNGTATFLYYDGWNLAEERNASGNVENQYIHGAMADDIITRHSGNTEIYYHYDATRSVIQLTNGAGSMVEQYSYDVFGMPTIKNAAGNIINTSAFSNRFMFTGREFISETGLYDYRNRMYSPALGRFLQIDPIRFIAGDINMYRYVGNDPINKTDPSGLDECVKGTMRIVGTYLNHNTETNVVTYGIRFQCCICPNEEYVWGNTQLVYQQVPLNATVAMLQAALAQLTQTATQVCAAL